MARMERLTSPAELREGGRYQLPSGEVVTAWCKAWPADPTPVRQTWALLNHHRAYVLDPTGAVRLVAYEDASGQRHPALGVDGLGAVTDFTVADLRLVDDGEHAPGHV
jgi:hypothetical protein